MVCGTFLIVSLILILCCACQGQNSNKPRTSYSPVAYRYSSSSLNGGGKVISNASTNTLENPCRSATTEDSSLEMSDTRSQSTKLSDDMRLGNCYVPPPSLYDTPPTPTPTDNMYNLLPTLNQHQTRPNPLYGMPQRMLTPSMMSEELPLPPPPPPHEVEEDVCVKGLAPSFKTFLDKTIAIKPNIIHMNSGAYSSTHSSPLASPHRFRASSTEQERRSLVTSNV